MGPGDGGHHLTTSSSQTPEPPAATAPRSSLRRRLLKGCGCGCGGLVAVMLLLLWALFAFLDRVPTSYPPAPHPIGPPTPAENAAYELDGFESPYLGHTGSWDGQGGAMFGGSKVADLDAEAGMGLRWTFMPAYWSALEPDGPVSFAQGVPPAWEELDGFVASAQVRKLNVLMQVVIGGNAGGPPRWAGRRAPGKSAPADIEAAAAFAGKLAERYKPGGTLARARGWGRAYGVRAWELDNEPNAYRTHWDGQAGDYAEFVTKTAARIRPEDPRALILLPATTGGGDATPWIVAALDAEGLHGSPAYRKQGKGYSIGPVADGISFHGYEGADSAFAGTPRTIERAFSEIGDAFVAWDRKHPEAHVRARREFWHTEGNFDFIGALSATRRAAWRWQFFTRGFAAGIRKVCVMDASKPERAAVKAYVEALPCPFPMKPADAEVKVAHGKVTAFRNLDGAGPAAGQVWVVWAVAGTGDAQVEIPLSVAVGSHVTLVDVDGTKTERPAPGGHVVVDLKGDRKMAPPVLVIDRPGLAIDPSTPRGAPGR
jgi:hypothetical protein